MKTYLAETLVDGLAFPEGPRWHDGQLWFTDQHAHSICRVDPNGQLTVVTTTPDLPGGLGWLPDGNLLVVFMTQRCLMQWNGHELTLFADLSAHASFHCNDMIVDNRGRVYVGNFGFDLHGGEEQKSAEIVMVDQDGNIETFSDRVVFPNGCVITPDGNELIVAETFAHCLTSFELQENGRQRSRRLWADLDTMTPDGICLDQDGMVWVASPATNEVIRVKEGGERLAFCKTRGTPYACMLGGKDRQMLFICTSETDDPQQAAARRSGRIEYAQVDISGAGLP
jgi:sugar lactone lactonase YvrE